MRTGASPAAAARSPRSPSVTWATTSSVSTTTWSAVSRVALKAKISPPDRARFNITINLADLKRDIESYLSDFSKQRAFPGALPEIAFKDLSIVAFVQDDADKSILHAVGGASEVGQEGVVRQAENQELTEPCIIHDWRAASVVKGNHGQNELRRVAQRRGTRCCRPGPSGGSRPADRRCWGSRRSGG